MVILGAARTRFVVAHQCASGTAFCFPVHRGLELLSLSMVLPVHRSLPAALSAAVCRSGPDSKESFCQRGLGEQKQAHPAKYCLVLPATSCRVLLWHDFVLCELTPSWPVSSSTEISTAWVLLLPLSLDAAMMLQREFCCRDTGSARPVSLFSFLVQTQLVRAKSYVQH